MRQFNCFCMHHASHRLIRISFSSPMSPTNRKSLAFPIRVEWLVAAERLELRLLWLDSQSADDVEMLASIRAHKLQNNGHRLESWTLNEMNFHLRNGFSLKYELLKHSSAVARFFGSYMNRKLSKRIPATDNAGNFCLILLYGCCFSVKVFRAGIVRYSGQMFVVGVPAMDGMRRNDFSADNLCIWNRIIPNSAIINSICWISVLPGNNGLCVSSSPKMQPAAHISMAVVCVFAPSNSSGARYHNVTTPGVIDVSVRLDKRAKPKSAILMRPLSVNKRFDTFKSRWMMKREWTYLSPLSSCSIRHLVCDSVNGFGILSSNEAKSCSQYSIEMKMLSRLLPTTTSFNLTMFSWSHICKIAISRKPLIGNPSFSLSIRTRFNATILPPLSVSRARSVEMTTQLVIFDFEIHPMNTHKRRHRCPHRFDSISRIRWRVDTCPTENRRNEFVSMTNRNWIDSTTYHITFWNINRFLGVQTSEHTFAGNRRLWVVRVCRFPFVINDINVHWKLTHSECIWIKNLCVRERAMNSPKTILSNCSWMNLFPIVVFAV